MNLTSKSRYALKIMMDLAHFSDRPLVRRAEIISRQGVPGDYLDQILMRLRNREIIQSIRGRAGGYRLGKSPSEISIWDIFEAVEDSIYPTECLSTGQFCDFEAQCVSKDAWGDVFQAIKDPLKSMSLDDLCRKWSSSFATLDASKPRGVQECRHG